MPLSNTQRTMKALRDEGLPCEIVEKWIPKANVRKDLFGIIDILAVGGQARGIIGVQSTGKDFDGHLKKMLVDKAQECIDWLQSGGRLWLWGWRQVKVKRGGKAIVWEARKREITLEDFAASLPDADESKSCVDPADLPDDFNPLAA